ncbi:hypothetical protein V9T40_012802 [Parthenolecanium corni]|uniref:MULE transposase domain-containing protein n=1 Tax=Parthenolecanium corni TaxID=536013 RepID=A0AAN9TNW6_9HEMI
MEFLKSEKGKPLIFFEQFTYRYHKTLKDGVQRWPCSVKTCKCHLKLSSSNILIEKQGNHNHEKCDENVMTRRIVSNSLKRKAVEDICTRPAKLIASKLREADVSTLTTTDVALIRHNMHRARLAKHPKLPNNAEETHLAISSMTIETNTGEKFLLVNDDVNKIIGFSSASNLNVLCQVQQIYVDGTFKSCPNHYTQLFIVHGLKNDIYVPLVFFLLPDKSTQTYQTAFEHIISKCASLGTQYSPSEVFIDFEVAIHKAVEVVWPDARIRGCRFHLGQSWWRKIQQVGLTRLYKAKPSTPESSFLKYFFGLPFLHPDKILDCFTEDLMPLFPAEDEKIEQFTDYIFNTYISPDATFSPSLWADYSATCNRTTNNCESFHSKLNSSFYNSHPNIYHLIDVLLDIQTDTYIKCRSKAHCRGRKKICDKEAFIREQMTKLEQGQLTRFQFVKILCFKFLPKP